MDEENVLGDMIWYDAVPIPDLSRWGQATALHNITHFFLQQFSAWDKPYDKALLFVSILSSEITFQNVKRQEL